VVARPVSVVGMALACWAALQELRTPS